MPEKHVARVEFEDKDGLISAELPILTTWAFENKSYAMPDVGDTVVCLFASNADQTGEGWIIGSHFTEKSKPPADSQDITRFEFKDGSFVQFDRSKGDLTIECKGNLSIKCEGDISIECEGNLSIECKGDINIESKGDARIKGRNIYLNE